MRRSHPATLRDLQRRALEREATRLLAADRRRHQSTPPAHPLAELEPTKPRRYTLSDLGRLRCRKKESKTRIRRLAVSGIKAGQRTWQTTTCC
jgi:hypothetical protein